MPDMEVSIFSQSIHLILALQQEHLQLDCMVLDGYCVTDMQLPHAIEFKPDGTRMFVTTNKDHSGNPGVAVYQFKLTTAWDTSTLDCENNI